MLKLVARPGEVVDQGDPVPVLLPTLWAGPRMTFGDEWEEFLVEVSEDVVLQFLFALAFKATLHADEIEVTFLLHREVFLDILRQHSLWEMFDDRWILGVLNKAEAVEVGQTCGNALGHDLGPPAVELWQAECC